MSSNDLKPNTYFIEVSGAGLPEVDGLFVPSTEPPKESESGTLSTIGYWNGKMAWDRADGKCDRNPSISWSQTYKSWRIARLDGHLAYHYDSEDDLPPTDVQWNVYKKGVDPAPKVVLHHFDPRLPCPAPNVVFVIGGPGSGKGTMCELAALQLGWSHLSVGELCREEMESGGPNAKLITDLLADGKLAPTKIVVELMRNRMELITRTTGSRNFLLDGFPRSLDNMEGWYEVFGRDADLPRMLYFECPYDVLEKRILGRAKYTGRHDDNIESVKLRFDTFKQQTLPTVEFFRSKNRVTEIDSSQDRQAVYSIVKDSLAEYTDVEAASKPLSERAEMLLGLRPFPKKKI
ncbi:nucleoside monophosphate kinase [Mariniblastus fucicola]|uniref:Adenylate kinase n=1 Tax=Mariniblastus fucicola TaxID=980251 RepID=A0A5B9PCA1_9BACT|nr:nucleoside monophosphate kinase [Mariniblastus fucicola]QEG24357.1 Adenylate kinase [Mariniblastus fucicola]